MKFIPIGNSGAQLIELMPHGDRRGTFTRTWCASTFADHGIEFTPVQGNNSLTRKRGTVRGMHFQRAPKADAKLVRCTSGCIHDVIVDIREGSSTRGEVYAYELSPSSGRMLYIPAGFAHGFQTLADDSVVEYLMGIEYVAELSDGFRHDDPSFRIAWPEAVSEMSNKDAAWPDFAGRDT